MKCTEFQTLLHDELTPLYECEEHEDTLVILTPIEYPDGDYVELTLIDKNGHYVLTDLAETVATLASYNLNLKSSPKRFRIFQNILKAHNVHYFDGRLQLTFVNEDELPEAVNHLTQTILRVSDLLFTMRYGAGTSFREEVEEYLLEVEAPFESNYRILGRSGHAYNLDFYVERPKPLLIQALSSGSTGYAETLVSKTVRMWYDIHRIDGRYDYSSIIDDSTDVWKPSQVDLLADLSSVIIWSERDELAEKITETT